MNEENGLKRYLWGWLVKIIIGFSLFGMAVIYGLVSGKIRIDFETQGDIHFEFSFEQAQTQPNSDNKELGACPVFDNSAQII